MTKYLAFVFLFSISLGHAVTTDLINVVNTVNNGLSAVESGSGAVVPSKECSSVNSPQAIAEALHRAGGEVSVETYGAINQALETECQTRTQTASVSPNLTTTSVLICVKAKIALAVLGEGGICTDTRGNVSIMTGVGFGLSVGVSATAMIFVYRGPANAVLGDYTSGGRVGHVPRWAIRGLPRAPGLGPEVQILSREDDGAQMVGVGISAGTMLDLSFTGNVRFR